MAIDSTENRIFEYTPDSDPKESLGGGAREYLRLIKEEIKPRIDGAFKTLQDPRMTGLCGSSLGGLVSLYGGIIFPETFGLIGALSPSLWWNKRSIFNYFDKAKLMPHKIYMDFGTSENENLSDINDFTDLLLSHDFKKNQNLKVIIQEGASHRELYWAQRFPETLKFLFPRVL